MLSENIFHCKNQTLYNYNVWKFILNQIINIVKREYFPLSDAIMFTYRECN